MRIDFYLKHLLRYNADAVELRSDQPVVFRFAKGERTSNAAISHRQVMQIVTEAAPPEALDELKRSNRCTFDHRSSEGPEVKVAVSSLAGDQWRVTMSPRAKPSAAKSSRPAMRQYKSRDEEPVGREDIAVNVAKASVPPPPAPAAPRVQLEAGEPKINRYLRMMVEAGASDLHLSSGVEPMVRLHGEMQTLEARDPFSAEELEQLLMAIAPQRSRDEFAATHDADFSHTIEGVASFRANYFLDRKGIGAVFRQIPFELLSVEQIGIPQKVLDLCWLTKGLVLVTGPTGSGKSTTLSTLIDFINQNRHDHIITIEDPIEFVHPNKKCLVNQREVGAHTKSFKNALRAALREDPDIVLVGEMRDLETISIAVETAETGHLVFGTLHTTSAIGTVDRIVDQFPADQQEQIRVMLADCLRGVIAQVLCKKEGGGRVAAYEILMLTHAAANLIRTGKTHQLASVMQMGKNIGMQTMNDHLLKLVRDGVVNANEAYMKSNDKAELKKELERMGVKLDVVD